VGPLAASLQTVNVKAADPRLSSVVIPHFESLRKATLAQAGWDFLGTLDSAVVAPGTLLPPGGGLSWLRTGRAIAIARSAASKGWLEIVPDPLGQVQYWRLFLRTKAQDGTEGEPLRALPWDFDARASGNPADYDAGGAYRSTIPPGYYVDFTRLASEQGWERAPADANWRSYYPGIRYWEFRITGGLDWFAAMNELFPPQAYLTPTPSPTPTLRPYWFGPCPTDTRWPTAMY
jgi:TolB protein